MQPGLPWDSPNGNPIGCNQGSLPSKWCCVHHTHQRKRPLWFLVGSQWENTLCCIPVKAAGSGDILRQLEQCVPYCFPTGDGVTWQLHPHWGKAMLHLGLGAPAAIAVASTFRFDCSPLFHFALGQEKWETGCVKSCVYFPSSWSLAFWSGSIALERAFDQMLKIFLHIFSTGVLPGELLYSMVFYSFFFWDRKHNVIYRTFYLVHCGTSLLSIKEKVTVHQRCIIICITIFKSHFEYFKNSL